MTVGKSEVNGFATDPVTLAYHELRSPLALMATMARSAAEDCDDDALRARCLSIVRTAERMLRTTGEVLDVAGVASDERQSRFSALEVVRKVVADYHGMGVAVTLTSTGAAESQVVGAPGQLEALLCSLLGNALDHGDSRVPVRVLVAETGGVLTIAITNEMSHIRAHKGLGLGSYIGDRLARALNATLELQRTDTEFAARIALSLPARELAFAV